MISRFTLKPEQLRPTEALREGTEFFFLHSKELLSDTFLFCCSPQSRKFFFGAIKAAFVRPFESAVYAKNLNFSNFWYDFVDENTA